MTNPIVAPDVLLLILRAVLKGRGGSRSELVGALRAVAEDEFGAIDRDDPVDEDISEFLLRADATRILAVRTWINALKVARGRRGVGIRSRVAAQDDGGALVSGPALFQDTIDILTDAEDPRAGALLGWSLGPCLAPAFDYGFVVGSLTPTRDNWEKLTLALQASAGSMRPARRRDAKVGRAGQRWLFPDIIDDDRDVMAVTIETLAATIAGRLGAERPAGVPLAPGAWPARSEDLLASLLGVTVRALEDEDVVQPG